MIRLSPVKSRFRFYGGRAFSLVEILVATSIAALMLVILAGMASQSMRVSRHTINSLTAVGTAAVAIDLVAADLDSLAVHRQPHEYLQAFPETGAINGAWPMRLMLNAISVLDSTAAADRGQVRSICYSLAWQNPVNPAGSGPQIFGLYRQVASSTNTFQQVLGKTDIYTGYWQSQPAPEPDEFLAGNVVDFQIAFYATQKTGGKSVVANLSGNSYQAVRISGNSVTVNGAALDSTVYSPTRLTEAEISIVVLSEAGAKLWGDGTGSGELSPTNLKKKYGHTLTRKVVLRSPY